MKHILIIAPPVVNEQADFASKLFKGGTAKGEELRRTYKAIAERYNCCFLDSNDYATVDQEEGVHLTADAHQRFAAGISKLINQISQDQTKH